MIFHTLASLIFHHALIAVGLAVGAADWLIVSRTGLRAFVS